MFIIEPFNGIDKDWNIFVNDSLSDCQSKCHEIRQVDFSSYYIDIFLTFYFAGIVITGYHYTIIMSLNVLSTFLIDLAQTNLISITIKTGRDHLKDIFVFVGLTCTHWKVPALHSISLKWPLTYNLPLLYGKR